MCLQIYAYNCEKCLISDDPLEEDHITLKCGHKFNYSPIYNEIKNQKCKRNRYEIQKLSKAVHTKNVSTSGMVKKGEAHVSRLRAGPRACLLHARAEVITETWVPRISDWNVFCSSQRRGERGRKQPGDDERRAPARVLRSATECEWTAGVYIY